jgi:peptidyl-prolyl cis-trans isomerase SurA
MKPSAMKRLAVLLAFFWIPWTAGAQDIRIAAVVNDDVISIGDLEQRLRLVLASSAIEDTPQTRQRVVPQVLRTLIDEKLEMQEAKRLNVKVTDKELQDSLSRLEAQNKIPPGGLDAYLQQRRIDPASLRDQITAAIAWAKLVRRKLASSVNVSEEEINEAMVRLQQNEGQPLNRVGEIFLAVDDPRQNDEVRRLAERLFEQLRQGASFSAVAQQFSQSATAAVGGDVGWVPAGQLGPELSKVVEQLQRGEVAPPIRASGGYYVLMLIDRRLPSRNSAGDTVVSLTQVTFPLSADAAPAQRAAAEAQAQQVADAASNCAEMIELGRQRAPELSGDLGRLKIADLPAELQPVVTVLPTGQPSKPVPLRGGIGVLMVCERQSAGLPSRDEVADAIGRSRLEALARRYLRDLRRVAFIDVRA